MGALQARLAVFVFVGLAAFIAYNMIFLQDGPHPAPYRTSVKSLNIGDQLDTRATARGRVRSPRRRGPGGTLVKTDTVRAVQRELATRGYDPGPADGVHGLLTRAAVMAYQHDKDLPVTGEISDPLLRHILLGVREDRRPSDAEVTVPKETVALIKAVQQILSKMGYDPGPIDGVIGGGTRRAIRTFEKEQKLPVKGRISGALLKALIRVTGAQLANIQSG